MNMLDISDVKWIQDTKEEVKVLSEKIKNAMPEKSEAVEKVEKEVPQKKSKLKDWVKKAVNCCIE